MAQQLRQIQLIRPHQINQFPHFTTEEKQGYKAGFTQLWNAFESSPQGSQQHAAAFQKLRQASLKLYHKHQQLHKQPAIGTHVADPSIMPGRIQDRVALVTGSAGGLGRSICLKLASEGARICCVDLYKTPRNKTNASTGKADDFNNRIEGESTFEEIARLYGKERVMFVPADVTKAEHVEGTVEVCVKAFGRVSSTRSIRCNPFLNLIIHTVGHPLRQRRHLRGINPHPPPRHPRNERGRLGQNHGHQRQRRLPVLQIRHRPDAQARTTTRSPRSRLDRQHFLHPRPCCLLQHSYVHSLRSRTLKLTEPSFLHSLQRRRVATDETDRTRLCAAPHPLQRHLSWLLADDDDSEYPERGGVAGGYRSAASVRRDGRSGRGGKGSVVPD